MITFDKAELNNGNVHIAVSMGVDSVVFSHFLSRGNRDICLVHVNHGTEYSELAQTKFESYCDHLGVSGIVLNSEEDTEDYKESDFRDLRYGLLDEYFETVCNKIESVETLSLSAYNFKLYTNQLVVCHHLGDAVESYIMNALTSATYDRTLPKFTKRDKYNVVRPFLKTPKSEVLKYADKHNLQDWVVEDPSNEDTSIRRNWVRRELVPKIKEQYSGIDKVVKKIYNEV